MNDAYEIQKMIKELRARKNKENTARYNLIINEDLHSTVNSLAKAHGTSMVEIFKRYIILGLIAQKVQDDGGEVIIRDANGEEKNIILV